MKTIKVSLLIFSIFTILTGIIYPLMITGIAVLCFNEKANGSLVVRDGRTVGSVLIGQQFDSAVYFTSRPSAISCNPLPSGASNYGLTNAKQEDLFRERRNEFIGKNHLDSQCSIPSEMLFASASGLDPHISPEAALLQADRVAEARHFTDDQKNKLKQCIHDLTEPPQFICLGRERINVLLLNLEADKIR